MPDAIAGRAYATDIQEIATGNVQCTGPGLLCCAFSVHAPHLVRKMEDAGIVTTAELPGHGFKPGHRFMNLQKSIKFSWDMGFQNLKWLHEVTKVLSTKQRKQLPAEMQSAFAYLEN
jgi:hypothetical protein